MPHQRVHKGELSVRRNLTFAFGVAAVDGDSYRQLSLPLAEKRRVRSPVAARVHALLREVVIRKAPIYGAPDFISQNFTGAFDRYEHILT